MGQAVAQLVGG